MGVSGIKDLIFFKLMVLRQGYEIYIEIDQSL